MLEKYNLFPIVRAIFADSSVRSSAVVGRLLLRLIFPTVIGTGGALAVLAGVPVANGVSVALPAVSLLVGAMFGAFVFLTNLRVKLAESATFTFRSELHRLVGSSAVGCLYVAVVSMLTAAGLGLVGSLPQLRDADLKPYVVGVLLAVFAHIGLSLLVVVRNLVLVYLDMFAADFNPKIEPHASIDKPRNKSTSRARR